MKGFRRLYPNDGFLQFDGGKNNAYAPTLILDNESPDCKNVVFDNGGPETRQGFSKLNTAAVGSYAFDGLYTRISDSGSQTMVGWAGGTMWTLATTTFATVPSAQSVYTAGSRVSADMYENYMFFGNGGSVPYKWNGAEFTRHGVYAPTSAMSTVSATTSTGVLTGGYRYKITGINSGLVESDVGPATTTLAVTSAKIIVTDIQTYAASYGINQRKLYRTVTSGTTFLLLTTLSDNTTTSYVDNTADGSLGATAPTDQAVPVNYSIIKYHQNRLFVNDPDTPNLVWYSELANPYVFKTTNFFRVGDNTSDLVRGFGVFENSLVVFCDRSIYLIYMYDTTPTNWQVIKTKSPYGSKSPYCVLEYNNKLLFAALEAGQFVGFASLSGNTVAQSTTFLTSNAAGSDLTSNPIDPDMKEVQSGHLANISGTVFKNKAWIGLTYGSGTTTNNRIYQMDFSKRNRSKKQEVTWCPFTGDPAVPNQFTVYNGNLYYGSSAADGFVYKAQNGTFTDGTATGIDSYFWTKEFSGFKGEEPATKDYRTANILVENSGDWFMNLRYRVNSEDSTGTSQQIDLNPGGSLWGSMVYGVDPWGGATTRKDFRVYLSGIRGSRIQFRFDNQNAVGQKFLVYGLKFTYNLKGFR